MKRKGSYSWACTEDQHESCHGVYIKGATTTDKDMPPLKMVLQQKRYKCKCSCHKKGK